MPSRGVVVAVEVVNTGTRKAQATAFLFVRDSVASVTRPSLELRGVRRITLGPSDRGTLYFDLQSEDVAFPRSGFDFVVEPGAVDVLVGLSADPSGLLRTRIRFDAP